MSKVLELTKQLVSIASESQNIDQLHEIVDLVMTWFDDLHPVYMEKLVYNGKPSLLVQNFEGKEADIVLSGHLDVVPASEDGQYEPYVSDGKLFGRGTGDMKSGCAVKIAVMQRLLQENYLDKKICLMLTTDEEIGGKDGVQRLVEEGYRAKVVLILDGGQSHQKVIVNEKGAMHFTLQVNGQSTHASRPWTGKNALDDLCSIYARFRDEIQETAALSHPDHWGTSVNMTVVQAGTVTNVIPDKVEAKFDIRFTQKYTSPDDLYTHIESILQDYDAQVTSCLKVDPLMNSDDDPYIALYHRLASSIWSDEISLCNHHGGCDGRFFSAKGSTVIVSEANSANLHGKQEWVLVEDLDKLEELYYQFVVNM